LRDERVETAGERRGTRDKGGERDYRDNAFETRDDRHGLREEGL
jgi:hypothetical protein